MFNNKIIFVSGGTGSFGNKFVEIVSKKYKPKKLLFSQEMNLNSLKCNQGFLLKNIHF